jgi:hypothetical protein
MTVPLCRRFLLIAVLVMVAPDAHAQGVRDHTRLGPNRATTVSEAQATELTLTVTEVAVRPIQTWVRTAGVLGRGTKTITAAVSLAESSLVKVGQRIRAFPPESRSSMSQARVTAVRSKGGRAEIMAELSGPAREGSTRYVLEIVAEHGDFLSIPNEAIIETGGKHVVYAQQEPGRYEPKEVQLGLQGELYTQVLSGLRPGEQVVTFGSFFVDADYKLKGS